MNENEILHEKEHLTNVLFEIDKQTTKVEKQINDLEKEMEELKHHFSEEYYNMDDEEAVCGGDELDEQETVIFATKNSLYRLKKQRLSPYFGKIDFCENGYTHAVPYYIGIFSLTDGGEYPVVCDWRAPISSMYYDYEVGSAKYTAPVGIIEGEIKNKRQFKIKNSKMEYVFDSNLTVSDDILQQELSNNSSMQMKNIVSTIQKEQNKIIRNEDENVLFVQGVAGSGKTSVALHRAAYLLYAHKDTISSDDILILSPNNIFSEYISQVLPELGEENIMQTSFYQIAKQELNTLTPALETREEMLINLSYGNLERLNEVAYKNSLDFCESLKIYLKTYVSLRFSAKDLVFGETKIKKEIIEELFNKKYLDKTPAVRVGWIADYIVDQLNVGKHAEEIYPRVKKLIYPMLGISDIMLIYQDFLEKIGMKFSLLENGKVRNEDIASLLYIKDYILGVESYKQVKYLIVDEMQDYSPVHFALISKMFDCKKTVLGDINQCIEKIITPNDLKIMANIMGAKNIIHLNKTYRSTYEITDFADNIKNLNSDKVARHGEKPQPLGFDNLEEEVEYISSVIKKSGEYNTIAIITKTQQQANLYYSMLSEFDDLVLADENSTISKLMIMPASLCKGLEFDVVILPSCTKQNYHNFMDKNLLYVSCTRALHKLYLSYVGDCCEFVK